MPGQMLTFESFTGGIAQTNGWLIQNAQRAIAIDAPEGFAHWLQTRQVTVEALLLTHQHFDHVLDAAAVAQQHACPIVAFSPYSRRLTLEELFGAATGTSMAVPPFEVTRTIGEGTVSEWLDAACEVIHVPGHSQDSIAFHFPSAGCLIGGDVLFRDGVGRTDLPDGDWERLIHSITAKLFRLPGSTTVHPGHGPSTTIDQERHFNPFLKP